MKKSTRVTLTVVAAVGLASCGRRRADPCQPVSFNETSCQDAIRNRGYYNGGSWVPMMYSNPYPYYYDSYRGYVSHSGSSSSGSSSSHGVERGGFGSSGVSHGAGA